MPSPPKWTSRLVRLPPTLSPPAHPSPAPAPSGSSTPLHRWTLATHAYNTALSSSTNAFSDDLRASDGSSTVPHHAAHATHCPPEVRFRRWHERALAQTGVTEEVWSVHEWTHYVFAEAVGETLPLADGETGQGGADARLTTATTASADDTPTDRFVSHALLAWLSATYIDHLHTISSSDDPSHSAPTTAISATPLAHIPPTHRHAALLHPTRLTACARALDLPARGLPASPEGLERFLRALYLDQHARFSAVKEALATASAPQGSALHTLFRTYSPGAQALGVVESVMRGLWERVEAPGAASAHAAACSAADPHAALTRYFQRKYGVAPDVHISFHADATYECTVRHLDGHCLARESNVHREAAAARACAVAVERLGAL